MLKRLFLLLAVASWHATTAPAASVVLRGELLERSLLDDLKDHQLDHFDLISAALIASGTTDRKEVERYREQVAACLPMGSDANSARPALAEECFDVLHSHLLYGRYHVEYSELSRTLDEGHYNCVTATILYCHLCEQAGLRPTIMATREHVFVRLDAPSGAYDVETTCAHWFELQLDPQAKRVPIETSSARPIGTAALLGKVFYNRAVQRLAEQKFQQAIELLETSLALDPADEPARENLLAAINNWSLASCREGRFEQALELLAWGRELDSSYPPFAANDLHIHQKWILELCRSQQFSHAARLVREGFQRRPAAPVFDEGRLAIYRLWAENCFMSGEQDVAWNVLDEARQLFGDDPRWEAHETAVLLAITEHLLNEGELEEARRILRRGLLGRPAARLLVDTYRRLTDHEL